MKSKPHKVDDKAKPRTYLEKIGKTTWTLEEMKLDVHKDVVLWHSNPRLQPLLPGLEAVSNDTELEEALRRSGGYDGLRRSIETVGQMEPIYAWKRPEQKKYVVFEGATRVAILRELDRKHGQKGGGSAEYKFVRAKILPPEFDDSDRTILLARIHVRGSGVRSWGRYVEAKFIYDAIVTDGRFTAKDMAFYMEKSLSWVTRLRDAYEFAKKFEDHLDDGTDGKKFTAEVFSTLEEISKAANIGSKLKEYDNKDHDGLREDVYKMVSDKVFSEYRDARFLSAFYEDPDKWAALKTCGEGGAQHLVAEIKAKTGSLKGRLAGLETQLQRALDRGAESFDEEDAGVLRRAADMIEEKLDPTLRRFRAELRRFTKLVSESSLADVKAIENDEIAELDEALDDFKARHAKAKLKAAG